MPVSTKEIVLAGSVVTLGALVYKGFQLQSEALSRLPSYDEAIADPADPRSFVYSLPVDGRPRQEQRPPPYNPQSSPPHYLNADDLDGAGAVGGGDVGLMDRRRLVLNLTQTQLRISRTYLYVASGLALAGASAAVSTRLGGGVVRHPWIFQASAVASLLGILYVDPRRALLKHLSFVLFNASMGANLSPLARLQGGIVGQAAVATGTLVGGLSLVAAASPSDRFLVLAGPLSAGLASLTGLALFSAFMLYDTQRVRKRAQRRDKPFDSMRESMDIYMNTVNVFIRIVTILVQRQQAEEKRKQDEEERRRGGNR